MATPTVETKIWMALRTRLEALDLDPAVTLIFPGETETLPEGTAVEVTHLPNRPMRRYLGSGDPSYREGLLQLGILTVPGAVHHQTVATEIAGDIVAHFAPDDRMPFQGVVVRAKEVGSIGTSFEDKKRARWVTPVTIRYHTEA